MQRMKLHRVQSSSCARAAICRLNVRPIDVKDFCPRGVAEPLRSVSAPSRGVVTSEPERGAARPLRPAILGTAGVVMLALVAAWLRSASGDGGGAAS